MSKDGCSVSHSRSPTTFILLITADGYGPYLADWSSQSHDQPVPSQFTAALEAAWSVGAILVDKDGKTVEGAKVFAGIEFKKRAGDHRQVAYGTDLKSDAEGQWRFHCVPVSKSEIFVQINHPDHMPLNRSLSRANFGLEPGREPTARIVLEPGLTVVGRVTNEASRPIAGALVAPSSTSIRVRRQRGPTEPIDCPVAANGPDRGFRPGPGIGRQRRANRARHGARRLPDETRPDCERPRAR